MSCMGECTPIKVMCVCVEAVCVSVHAHTQCVKPHPLSLEALAKCWPHTFLPLVCWCSTAHIRGVKTKFQWTLWHVCVCVCVCACVYSWNKLCVSVVWYSGKVCIVCVCAYVCACACACGETQNILLYNFPDICTFPITYTWLHHMFSRPTIGLLNTHMYIPQAKAQQA